MEDGSVNTCMCEFKIVSTRCKETSLDRIACDFKSRSLLAES